MRPSILQFCLLGGIAAPLFGAEIIVPEFLATTDIGKTPYKYNGLLSTDSAIGSASLVGDGIIATAAHVIYDDENLTWIPINDILYYPRYHQTTPFSPSGTFYPPVAFIKWESYKTRVDNDESGPGLSSPDTFNIDFAVGYLNKFLNSNLVDHYPEVHVDAENVPGILREDRDKMIVGYPSDTDFIDSSHRGLMHRTPPANYFCWWGGLEDFTDTWRDSEDFWVATYEFEGVATYAGNSGGPVYVLNDEGRWMVAGIVVGSIGSEGVLARAIDEGAWDLIESAKAARGVATLPRVEDLQVSATAGTSVKLDWADFSDRQTGYEIHRLDEGSWTLLAEVGPDQTSFRDVSARPGRVYRYTVQPLDQSGNRAPKSREGFVALAGQDVEISAFLNQPWLEFMSAGDSNWHVVNGSLRAGAVGPLGMSSLQLPIIGPGTVQFDWRASSEANVDYQSGTPDNNPLYDDIYDAVYLYLDGNPVVQGEEVFLSGITGTQSRELVIPEGPHTIEWIYRKDPYTSEGEDTAFLESLQWIPDASAPYPVLGGYSVDGTDRHSSAWFGEWTATGTPWVAHHELGWIYLRPGTGHGLFLYSHREALGDLYTDPEIYPYLYSVDREDWLYYYKGSGQDGSHLLFYDFRNAALLRIP